MCVFAARQIGVNHETSMSSVHDENHAYLAVDGKYLSSTQQTCFRSGKEVNPWWSVDFGTELLIHDVLIYGNQEHISKTLPMTITELINLSVQIL